VSSIKQVALSTKQNPGSKHNKEEVGDDEKPSLNRFCDEELIYWRGRIISSHVAYMCNLSESNVLIYRLHITTV